MLASGRPTSVLVALHIISSLSAAVSAMTLERLEGRAVQTNAVCSQGYAWADTTTHNSPCLVAAQAIAPCNGGNWNISALTNSSQFYSNPGTPGNAASQCVCSWAVYNLMSACSDCQGVPQAVRLWPDYKSACPAALLGNTTFYPSEFQTPGLLIPYWAATDPTQWMSSQYNAPQAQAIAQQAHADIGSTTTISTTPKKSSVGPIVGGVIGGLVVLGLAAGVAYFLLRRHRLKIKNAAVDSAEKPGNHQRNPSDQTMISQTSLGYTALSSSPGIPTMNGAPTIRTHATSINSFSVFGSPNNNANTIYSTTPSPPPRAFSSNNPEDYVIPFTLQHQRTDTSLSAADRKGQTHIPIYDSPNAPPNRTDDMLLLETPERPRVNPPAYSPQDTSPSGSGQQQTRTARGHHTNNSSDADLSYASLNPSGLAPRGHPIDTSGSSVFTTPHDAGGSGLTRSGSAQQTTYTQSAVSPSYPRDVKRRPTEDSINPQDLG